MTLVSTTPRRALAETREAKPLPQPVAFNFTQSDSFALLLKQLGVSLLVTTYQAIRPTRAAARG